MTKYFSWRGDLGRASERDEIHKGGALDLGRSLFSLTCLPSQKKYSIKTAYFWKTSGGTTISMVPSSTTREQLEGH
jgi:hypothetical protein